MPWPRSIPALAPIPHAHHRLAGDDSDDERDAEEREFASMRAIVRRLRHITSDGADEPVDESDDEESDGDDTEREPHPRGTRPR